MLGARPVVPGLGPRADVDDRTGIGGPRRTNVATPKLPLDEVGEIPGTHAGPNLSADEADDLLGLPDRFPNSDDFGRCLTTSQAGQ